MMNKTRLVLFHVEHCQPGFVIYSLQIILLFSEWLMFQRISTFHFPSQ